MRLEPRHRERQPVGGGRPRDQLAYAIHIEHQPALRADPARVEMLGPQQPRLLADAQHHLDVAVGNVAFAQDADGLEDGDNAGLVVSSQHRAAIGAHDVAFDHQVDLLRWPHGVHVCREEEGRRSRPGAGEPRQDIARLAAHLLPRVVHFHGGTHALENALEAPRDGALATRQAGDPCQLEELVLDARRVDHAGSLWR